MSDPSRKLDATAVPAAPAADAVERYLRDHPDFLHERPDLLDALQLDPTDEHGPSLTGRQMQRLRETNERQRSQLHDLLGNARRNDALFQSLRNWVGRLIDCRTPVEVIEMTTAAFEQEFGADAAALCFVADVPILAEHPHMSCIDSAHAEATGLDALAAPGQIICGLLRRREIDALFGDRAAELQSAVVIGLDHPDIRGVLAAARRDPNHFRPGMDTLFVRFTAELLCRMLARLDFRC